MAYTVNLGDLGSFTVEKEIFDVLQSQQNSLTNLQYKLPTFYKLKSNFQKFDKLCLEFLAYTIANHERSSAQLYQDLFAEFFCVNTDRKFIEFGATDGISLSNTYALEKYFSWSGLLIEPSPQWHESLMKNRRNSKILDQCVYSESNKTLDFYVSETGVLSTLDEFRYSDELSMPGNAEKRNQRGNIVPVNTISLNDVHKNYCEDKAVNYISVDTEGSEYEILKNFDFAKYGPTLLTIEHNYSASEVLIDRLLQENGYVRLFKEMTEFDAWYLKKENYLNLFA